MALPKEKDIPGAHAFRRKVVGFGLITGLLAYGFAQNSKPEAMLICGALSALTLYGSTKIKVRQVLVAETGIYRPK